MKNRNSIFTIILVALGSIAFLSPKAFGVNPPPDGGYPGFNTAEGQKALFSLTTGAGNTGLGWYSLFSDSTGGFNTGVGAGTLALNNADSNTALGAAALLLNTNGTENTAVGTRALLYNDIGAFNTAIGSSALWNNTASGNTAIGSNALMNNTTGGTLENISGFDVGPNVAVGWQALESNTVAGANTAVGYQALHSFTAGPTGLEQLGLCTAVGFQALANTTSGWANSGFGYQALLNNTTGYRNTAIGHQALYSNAEGYENTAIGSGGLLSNTTGHANTATGWGALAGNTEGSANTATGYRALQFNLAGVNNTAIGNNALNSASGNLNTALGAGAGQNQTDGSGNVYIGAIVSGVAGENDTTYIRNVYSSVANARAVYVNADNKIGTLSSSRRYKQDIRPMDKASEGIFALKPVTFRYKKEIDRSQALSFGLIAEEVAEISPDLITRDEEGKPQTVRYEAVNAMLLNEFLKEHKKVEEQQECIANLNSRVAKHETTIAQQQKGMDALTAQLKQQAEQLQKVSAQLELGNSGTQVALKK